MAQTIVSFPDFILSELPLEVRRIKPPTIKNSRATTPMAPKENRITRLISSEVVPPPAELPKGFRSFWLGSLCPKAGKAMAREENQREAMIFLIDFIDNK